MKWQCGKLILLWEQLSSATETFLHLELQCQSSHALLEKEFNYSNKKRRELQMSVLHLHSQIYADYKQTQTAAKTFNLKSQRIYRMTKKLHIISSFKLQLHWSLKELCFKKDKHNFYFTVSQLQLTEVFPEVSGVFQTTFCAGRSPYSISSKIFPKYINFCSNWTELSFFFHVLGLLVPNIAVI